MIDNYIVSYVIMPHGITDLTKCKINQVPLLMIIYLISLLSCGGLHELIRYGHIILFLFSSLIHFSQDFIYIGKSYLESICLGSLIIIIPFIFYYIDLLWIAKNFMILYMILFHVPLHYKRVKINRKDLISIIGCTFIFGIIGPSMLKEIEDNKIEGSYSIGVCGLVVGHVSWNSLGY